MLISLAIALGVIAVLSLRTGSDDGQIVTQPRNRPTRRRRHLLESKSASPGPTSPPPAAASAKHGRQCRRRLHITVRIAGGTFPFGRAAARDTGDAPIQAWHGSTIDVSVGVPLGAVVRSVKFRVSYDADSLEVLNIIDATGTMLMAVPSGDGSVELDFDTDQGPYRRLPSASSRGRTFPTRCRSMSARTPGTPKERHSPLPPSALTR